MHAVQVPSAPPDPAVHDAASDFALHSPFTGTLPVVHWEQYVFPLMVTSHFPVLQLVALGSAALHGVGAADALAQPGISGSQAAANATAKAKVNPSNIRPGRLFVVRSARG